MPRAKSARTTADPATAAIQRNRTDLIMSEARNAGLAALRSDLVVFLDADDELLSGAIARGVEALVSDPSAAVVVELRGMAAVVGSNTCSTASAREISPRKMASTTCMLSPSMVGSR